MLERGAGSWRDLIEVAVTGFKSELFWRRFSSYVEFEELM